MTTENDACDKGGFTIVWKLENFSHCLVKNGNSMESPSIKIPKFSGVWRLYFYPRGRNTACDAVECDLRKIGGDSWTTIDCLLCVCTSKGERLYKNETENLQYHSGYQKNVAKFERNIFERLPDDTLVIHCHVWDHNSDRSEISVHCFVRTPISLQHKVFYWKVDKFSTLQLREEKNFALPTIIEYRPSLTFILSLVGTNVQDASVQISLKFEGGNSETFFTCTLFVMGPNGTAKKYMRDEYVLDSGSHLKMFPYFLQRRDLVTDDLSEDTLTIRGEVTFSGNYDSVEQVVYGLQTQEAVVAATSPVSRPSTDNPPSALSADMLALFEGSGPPSDFELRVEGRSFPVHQLVLGTRSAVFRAMFDNDMLEQSTKIVELTDLDVDTAERLLKFAYADVEPPAGLAWEQLASLYSAADKYEILALRKICARRLVQLLDPANAPKILQLADRHRDSHLKEDVIDYLFKRGRAVLESDQWKSLEQDDPQLAVDTLRRIFCEKVLIQPLEFRNEKQ